MAWATQSMNSCTTMYFIFSIKKIQHRLRVNINIHIPIKLSWIFPGAPFFSMGLPEISRITWHMCIHIMIHPLPRPMPLLLGEGCVDDVLGRDGCGSTGRIILSEGDDLEERSPQVWTHWALRKIINFKNTLFWFSLTGIKLRVWMSNTSSPICMLPLLASWSAARAGVKWPLFVEPFP